MFRDPSDCGTGARTELVNAEDQDGLVDLEAEDLGLDELKGLAVDLDETLTGLRYSSVSNSQSIRVFFGGIARCASFGEGVGRGFHRGLFYLAVGDSCTEKDMLASRF